MKPVQNRVLVGGILALLGLALYLGIDLHRSGRERVIQQFNTTQLVLAQEGAHEAVLLLRECADHLGTLARLTAVQRGDPQRIPEELQRYSQREEVGRHTSIMVVNPSGGVAFGKDGLEAANFQGCEFLAWSKVKKNQSAVFVSHWSRVREVTNAAIPNAVFLAKPLYQSNWDPGARRSTQSWTGVLVMTVDLQGFLTEHLTPLSPQRSPPRLWIMDQDGTILLQSEHPEMVRENVFRPQLECAQCHVSFDYAQRMLAGRVGTTEYQLKGQPKKLAAFVPVRFANASWVMVVNAPYDEVLAFVGQSYRQMLLLLGTVVAAFGLASVMVHRTNLSRARAKEEARHWQQKHQLEEQLRRTEERYRMLFQQSPDGIVMLDPVTLLPVEFNDAAHRQLGYSREEFARMTACEHAAHGTPEEIKARVAGILQAGSAHFEIEQRTRLGKLRTVDILAQTLRLGDQTLLHCIHHDITERKRAEDVLTGRSAQLEALHQASLSIAAEMETGLLLQTIKDKALRLFRGHSAGLWLHRRGSDELECVVSSGDAYAPDHAVLKKGQSLAGACWEKGIPLVVKERRGSTTETRAEAQEPGTSAMAAPLRWGDAFLGVLEIHAAGADAFTRDDTMLLGLFASQAAIAVKNAGLLERVRRDESIKTTLLHDVSHRVKNNLARLLEIIRLERERVESAAVGCQAAFADLEDRLRGMELVHRMLSTSEWQPLPLRELATQIVAGALSGSPIRDRIRVSVLTPGEPLRVVPEQATAIALILSELATNSVKHAFENRTEGRLDVKFGVEGAGQGRPIVRLHFRDDGPGWPADVLSGRSRHVGLHLIQASIRSPLRGELKLHNDHGAVAEVAFKLALME